MTLSNSDVRSGLGVRGRPPRVTLKHVAQNAGVSIGTVSDIVNRGLSKNYTTETQARVHAAIRELGYRPARAAQDLRRGRSDTVSVLLSRGFDNPYYVRLFNEIQIALERHGLVADLMVLDMQRKGNVRKGSDWIISRGVDGLIVGPVYYWHAAILEELAELRERGLPIVTFGAIDEAGMCNVLMHDDEGGRSAVEYLLKRGHRRIAFLGAYPPADARLGRRTIQEGVERALQSQRLLDRQWFIQSPDEGRYEDYFRAANGFATRWLTASAADRPTALICKTDQIAITALAALHRRGIAVPEQLSVIGYDNVPEAPYTIPALTTIDNAMGARMAAVVDRTVQLLHGAAEEGESPTGDAIRLQVVERDSVRSAVAGP